MATPAPRTRTATRRPLFSANSLGFRATVRPAAQGDALNGPSGAQQRGVLHPKRRQARHQVVNQGDVVPRGIGKLRKQAASGAQSILGTQRFAARRCLHHNLPYHLEFAWQYAEAA